VKPDCCSGQLQRLPVLHQGVSGAGHLRGEQVVLARRARLKVAPLCRLGLDRPRPARERRRLHEHICATPSILVLEGQQSMPCRGSEDPLTGRRPGGRPRPRPGRPGCAGAPRQEAAPRAQVVHALPAVVAAPAPLDGHGAALKVGLRRSADPAQLVRPPSKLCVPLHVLTSISQPAGLPQRGRKQSRPHTRIADSPTCWASCTGGPCC